MRLIAALALLASGCSFVFMEPLRKPYSPSTSDPRCTSTAGAPTLDILIVAANIGGILWALNHRAEAERNGLGSDALDDATNMYVAGAAAGGALYAASALTGFSKAGQCREAWRKRDAFLAAQGAAQPVPAPAPRAPRMPH
jgi:hypothetical protein